MYCQTRQLILKLPRGHHIKLLHVANCKGKETSSLRIQRLKQNWWSLEFLFSHWEKHLAL